MAEYHFGHHFQHPQFPVSFKQDFLIKRIIVFGGCIGIVFGLEFNGPIGALGGADTATDAAIEIDDAARIVIRQSTHRAPVKALCAISAKCRVDFRIEI